MKDFKHRCLGVLVVYDESRAPFAIERFMDVISNSFANHTVRVVSNNIAVQGDLIGSNKCGEFSGWDEGIGQSDFEDFDVILLANDTFSTKRPFEAQEQKRFIESISSGLSQNKMLLVGELCWHINYKLLLKRKKFLLKWVRTNIFAISTEAAKKIGGVSLGENQIASMVESDGYGQFMLSQAIPEVNRRRVEDWLNPITPSLGWHGAKSASISIKKLKAKCVLQELDLTKRCIDAGVCVYSTTKMRNRDYLLALLYNLQERFL